MGAHAVGVLELLGLDPGRQAGRHLFATAYFRQAADAAWYVGELGLKLLPRKWLTPPGGWLPGAIGSG